MSRASSRSSAPSGHGDVFADNLGAMIVHVQREAGIAHRTFVLRPWQVRAVRLLAYPWTRVVLVAMFFSWAYLAIQAARVPLLRNQIVRMEEDAVRLDTLQQTMADLQARYDQLQVMLSRPAASAPSAASGTRAGSKTP